MRSHPALALEWPSSRGQIDDTTGETVGKIAKTGVSGFAHGVLIWAAGSAAKPVQATSRQKEKPDAYERK